MSNGDVRRAKDAVSADTSVDKLADFEQNAVGAINAEAKRADLSVLKEATDEKQLSDNRAPAVAPAPAAAVANNQTPRAGMPCAGRCGQQCPRWERRGSRASSLLRSQSELWKHDAREGTVLRHGILRPGADQGDARRRGLQHPLPDRRELQPAPDTSTGQPVILANRGSIVVDTPWYKTATEYLSEGGAYTQLGYASNTRYLVVDFDKPEEATKTQQQVTQKALPQEILQLARVGDDTRVLIPTRRARRSRRRQYRPWPPPPPPPRRQSPRRMKPNCLPRRRRPKPRCHPHRQPARCPRPIQSRKPRTGRRNAGQLETARAFGTFDEFDAHVRKLGAQFLLYREPCPRLHGRGGQRHLADTHCRQALHRLPCLSLRQRGEGGRGHPADHGVCGRRCPQCRRDRRRTGPPARRRAPHPPLPHERNR